MQATTTNNGGLLQRVLNHPWIERETLSFHLSAINPLWSLTDCRARIVEIRDETHDTKSFVLEAGSWWTGFRAGQNLGVAIEIDGVTHRRRYSISSCESGARRFTITTKRVLDGRVSNWMHDHLQAGDVLNLAPVAGDFVLPQSLPPALLMLAAGSGITPLMSQVRSLLAGGYGGQLRFVHYVRTPQDRIFGAELEELADQHANLDVQWCCEDDGQGGGAERFSPEQLTKRVANYPEMHTLLCGPAGFMAAVRDHWQELGRSDQLQFEYFGTPPVARKGAAANISLLRQQREFTGGAQGTLLEALEAAGESPAYGCRMGICHSCKCRKTSGQVRNLLTGAVSADPDQDIQLCISVAESDIELDY